MTTKNNTVYSQLCVKFLAALASLTILFPFNISSQNLTLKPDSLRLFVKDSRFSISGEQFSAMIFNLSSINRRSDIKWLTTKSNEIDSTDDYQRKTRFYEIISRLFFANSQYDEALIFSKKAIAGYQLLTDSLSICRLHSIVGQIYNEIGSYDLAIRLNKRALQVAERNNFQMIRGTLLTNLGISYQKLGQYSEAISYLMKALEIKLDQNDQQGIGNGYNYLGEVYIKKGDTATARMFFDRSFNIRQLDKDTFGISETYHNYGRLAQMGNDYEKAMALYMTGLNYAIAIDNPTATGFAYFSIGKLYYLEKNHAEAKNYLLKSFSIGNQLNNALLRQANANLLSIIHKENGDFKSSLEYKQILLNIKDSLINTQNKIITNLINDNVFSLLPQQVDSESKSKVRFTYLYGFSSAILLIILLIIVLKLFRNNGNLKNLYKKTMEENLEIQKRLTSFNVSLENEVSIRTKALQDEINEKLKVEDELNKALKRTEEANTLKNVFLSNISHEIRTPLNGIIGFSNLLEVEVANLNNKELLGYANGIVQSGDRLMRLLNNLIDISRIEANDMELTLLPNNLNEIVGDIFILYTFKAYDKGLELIYSPQEIPEIICDKSTLERVLSDIIDNALKYTEQGTIEISTFSDPNHGKVGLRIKDTGIGIEKEYLPHIFEAFRQESVGYNRTYQGAGLGLPLAKRLVNLMKGKIEISSEKGKGTEVCLWFNSIISTSKVVDEDSEMSLRSPEDYAKASPSILRIFVVEDDKMNRLVLRKMLSKIGDITLAVNGEETLNIIDENAKLGMTFDIMLFDINLPPPWDGTFLMQKIKQNYPQYRSIPFIAQTAYAMSGDRERLLEAGFDDYISKPISKFLLFKVIEKYIVKNNN